MDFSSPGFPVLDHLLEFAQTPVHWVSGAVLQSHPLLSPSFPAFNLSQHQGLFKEVSSSHQLPDRRLNVGALLWKCGVLTVGPPGKSLAMFTWGWMLTMMYKWSLNLMFFVFFFPIKWQRLFFIPPYLGYCKDCVLSPSVVSDSCDRVHCSLPGSSVHGTFQARKLGWVAISSSRESLRPRDWTQVSCVSFIAGRPFPWWAIREVQWVAIKIANLSGGVSYIRNNSHYFFGLFLKNISLF